MRKGKLRAGLCGFLLACWVNVAVAASDGMILGFNSGDEVELVSLVATRLPIRAQPVMGGHWSIHATDSSGREIWTHSFAADRQFDGVDFLESSFVVVVPRPESDTRLSMRDENDLEIWSGSIDEAMLRVADESSASIRRELVHASGGNAAPERESTAWLALKTRQADAHFAPTIAGEGSSPDATSPDAKALSTPGDSIAAERLASNPFDAPGARQEGLKSRERSTLPEGNSANPASGSKIATVDSWELDIHLLDPSGHALNIIPSGHAFSWEDPGNTSYPFDSSPGRIRVRVPQRTDFVYRLLLTDNPGYTPEITIRLGKFSANASIEVNLSPAAEAKIRLLVDGGTPVPSGSKTVNCDSEGVDPVVDYRQRVVMGTDTQATLSLPYHVALECSVRFNNGALDAHFKDIEFSSSAVKLLNLPETGEVTIKLVEENGQEFTGGGIVWHDSNASSSCSSSPCRLRLPPRTPLDLHVLFASGTYRNFTIGPEVFPPGTVRVIPLIREYAVKGNVSFAGLDSGHTRIRALDSTSGRLVLSVKTQWPTGDFELPLVAGKYIFEAERNLGDLPPGEAAYRAPWRSDPIQISRNTELPPFVVEDDLGQLALTAEVPCHGSGNYQTDSAARVIFTSATGARIERVVSADSAGSTTSTPCLSLYLAALSAGTYNIEFSPVGWPAQSLGPVMVTAGATTALTAAFSSSSRTLVWSGTLRTASGEPVTNAFINLFNGALDNRISAWTDAQGRFQFPFASGWIAQVTTGTFQAGTAAVPQIVHLGTTPPSSNLRLDDLALVNEIDSGLYRLFGDGQRDKRFNLVFVAEGYTDVIETFTDTNGNGIWDGNIWYDIDGDGVYSQGDLNRTYGSAPYPVEGTIPTAGNEPFADTNADGFPSLDDRGLFLENVRAFLKSLFGSDFWDQHRNAFNAYALFEPSDQAGYSIITSNGDMLLPRNTRYGATLLRGSDTLAIDRSQALLNRAHVALPETDLAVAMINQPIFVGEANASRTLLVYRGGPASLSNGSAVPAHGMGHAIAGLCDEFGEFSGVTQRRWQSGAYCPNVSLSPNPLHIPWANWLIPGSKIPSSSIDDSIGIFEGAQFYSGGTYRPSYRSMMRDSTPLFNAPSRAALEMAVHTRTGEWQDEADNLGRCARLPPTAIRRQGVTCR